MEIKTLISHPMHTGFMYDNRGELVARDILTDFSCRYLGNVVFKARFHPSVAANPFLSFFITAKETGPIEFLWTDQHGQQTLVRKEFILAAL